MCVRFRKRESGSQDNAHFPRRTISTATPVLSPDGESADSMDKGDVSVMRGWRWIQGLVVVVVVVSNAKRQTSPFSPLGGVSSLNPWIVGVSRHWVRDWEWDQLTLS